ncbi:MAG: hypothetical protein V6Z78_01625 [Holosporaceae bacterium]
MMFSYSKRLALLLTVCGTLLNTSPLLAAKDDATTKSSWLKPWTWGKKKDNKPKETTQDLLDQLDTRLKSFNKLIKENNEKLTVLQNLNSVETDLKKQEARNKKSTKIKIRLEALSDWKLILEGHQSLLEACQKEGSGFSTIAVPPEKINKIKKHLKDSADFLKKVYGRKRRLTSWGQKKLGRNQTTTERPSEEMMKELPFHPDNELPPEPDPTEGKQKRD